MCSFYLQCFLKIFERPFPAPLLVPCLSTTCSSALQVCWGKSTKLPAQPLPAHAAGTANTPHHPALTPFPGVCSHRGAWLYLWFGDLQQGKGFSCTVWSWLCLADAHWLRLWPRNWHWYNRNVLLRNLVQLPLSSPFQGITSSRKMPRDIPLCPRNCGVCVSTV